MIKESVKQRLKRWWIKRATVEVTRMVGKLDEYGVGDIHAIGYHIAKLAGWNDITHAQAYELGVTFYIFGKIQRTMTAAENHRTASDDTWHDISVYATMVLANRAGVMPV